MSTTEPTPGTPLPATIRRGGLPMPSRVAWLLIAALIVVLAFSLFSHRESKSERMVAQIIVAVQHNDMAPVANDFDAPARESMTHERVGHLSDLLVPMGALKSVHETTKDPGTRKHTYVAHFERGDWNVIMPMDIDGKAEGFRMERAQAQ